MRNPKTKIHFFSVSKSKLRVRVSKSFKNQILKFFDFKGLLFEKLQGFSSFQIEISVDFFFQNEFRKTYDGIKVVLVTIKNSYIS